MRVWIEINRNVIDINPGKFHPLMRVWIEIFFWLVTLSRVRVSPSYEGVD